jgi:hypothetical protein
MALNAAFFFFLNYYYLSHMKPYLTPKYIYIYMHTCYHSAIMLLRELCIAEDFTVTCWM